MKLQKPVARVVILLLIVVGVGAPEFLKVSKASETHRTSSEAAKAFMETLTYLAAFSDYETSDGPYEGALRSLISPDSFEKLRLPGTMSLLRNMVDAMDRPVWATQSESSGDGTSATVNVKPDTVRRVVCVREGEKWRVDLIATYAIWFNLDDGQTEKLIARQVEVNNRSSCHTNIKRIALGLKQYLQDHDEKYPPAKRWEDAVMPYINSSQIFKCPSIPESTDHRSGGGYAFNWKLSGKNDSIIESSASMAMLYESTALKPNHSGDGRDMAYRHMGGTNIGFVDGHVKWFKQKPEKPEFERAFAPYHFTFKTNLPMNTGDP